MFNRRAASSGLMLISTMCAAPSIGCKEQTPKTVVLSEWMSKDYAKAACGRANANYERIKSTVNSVGCEAAVGCSELMLSTINACGLGDNGEQDFSSFEKDFKRAFVTDEGCKGITLSYEADKLNLHKQGWRLSFDYVPGKSRQNWGLNEQLDYKKYLSGEGSAKESAHSVCTIMQNKGGSISRD